MSDAPRPQFFQAIKGSRAERRETVACALLFDPTEPLDVASTRLTWSSLMGGRLREIARAAAETGKPEGKSLPYAALRAAIQVQVPDSVMLSRDLGRPWAREDSGAFMHVAEGTGGNCAARASGALRTWVGMVMRPWAQRLGLDEGLVDVIDDACAPNQAFAQPEHRRPDLAKSIATGQTFDRLRHPILQEVSRRLDGAELFPGLGPVYRIVRGRSSGNEVQFQTWPTPAKSGGMYSMVAILSLESMPYLDRPLLTVRASRRRWLDDVPEPARLRRQRSMTGYLMGRNVAASSRGGPLAVEFIVTVRSGVPDEPCSPQFMHQALSVRADLALPVAAMVQARGQDVFLGFAYSPQRDGKSRVGAGASTRDQVDLLDAVAKLLAAMGMRPLPFEEQGTRREPKRAEEYHKALEAEALVAEFAVALGSNELDEEDLLEAARMLMEGAEPPAISAKTAIAGRAILETIQSANRARLRRAFGDAAPTIVLVARRESERLLMRAAINGLFGGGIDIAERQLPRNVHGPQQGLPEADKRAKARFAARLEAWQELADEISLTYGGCHVLVQADEWYERKHDDVVNKLAGRQALATVGNANVQYLLPAGGGWRGLAGYLNRIQAAVYDLMFGHSALVTEVRSLLKLDFPNVATRPRAIIGISLVTQARLRSGAKGGQLCLATRIDAVTGRTTARIGWFERAMSWTAWMPFFDAMKHIAGLDAAALGPNEEVKRRSYQAFVTEVIDTAVAADERPVVLIDSTSAAGLWPWITDARIGGPPVIGAEGYDKAEAWASARLIRIRAGHAGRVLERSTVRYQKLNAADGSPDGEAERYCPTATAKTIEVARQPSGRGWHYWITSSYFQATRPRGLSVYRALEYFMPVAKVRGLDVPPAVARKGLSTLVSIDISDEPYRVPTGLDVTVATLGTGDDPARITHLVASLRCGYGHSRLSTTLPAPLFFETKARDYMARFAIDGMDGEGDEGDEGDEEASVVAPDKANASPSEGFNEPEGADEGGNDTEFLDAVEAEEAADVAESQAQREVPRPNDARSVTAESKDSVLLSLLRPWSRLLRPSLAVRLVETTYLTGQRIELPFEAMQLPVSGPVMPDGPLNFTRYDDTKIDSTDNNGASAGSGSPLAAEAVAMDAVTTDATKTESWLALAKDIILPVPPFATTDWLMEVSAIPGNNRLVREIHCERDLIRDLTGFDWPEERPFGKDAAEVMVAGLRHAAFLPIMMDVAYLSLDKNKQRKFWPFSILMNRIGNYYWLDEVAGRRPLRRAKARTGAEVARALVGKGQRVDALSVLYTTTLRSGWAKPIAEVVKDCQLTELDAFIAAIEHLGELGSGETIKAVKNWYPNDRSRQHGGEPAAPIGADKEGLNEAPDDELCDTDANVLEAGESADWSPDGPADEPAAEALDTGEEAAVEPEVSDGIRSAMTVDDVICERRDDPTATGDAVNVARAGWREAMAALVGIADQARDADPDVSPLRALIKAVRDARSTLRAFDAAQPRLADAWPLIVRAKAVLDRFAGVPNAPATDGVLTVAESAASVDPKILEEATGLVEEAERFWAEAEAARAQIAGIAASIAADPDQGIARFNDMIAFKRTLDTSMWTTLNRVGAGNAILLAGVEQAAVFVAASAEFARRRNDASDAQPVTGAGYAAPLAPHAAAPSETARAAKPSKSLDADSESEPRVALAKSDATPYARSAEPDGDGDAQPPEALDDEDPGFELAEAAAYAAERADEPLDAVLTTSEEQFAPVEPVLTDPMIEAVTTKVVELVTARAFGAAYHLRRAAGVVFPSGSDFRFTAAELRLAAMSGRIGHVAMQGSPLLERVLSGAIEAVGAAAVAPLADEDDHMVMARRIIVAASCAELAMFHPGLPAVMGSEIIAETTPELNDAFRDLLAGVAEGARYGLITPALLRTVGQEKADGLYLESCRQAVLDNIAIFAKMHFNWAPANRIRANLHLRSGVVGEFRDKIEANDEGSVAAARAFAKEYRDRGTIMSLAEKVDRGTVNKHKALDGAARERLVSAFEELSALSAEYVDAADAASSARSSSQKTLVQRIAQVVASGADQALRALTTFAQTAPPLSSTAAAFAIAALTRLKDASQGRFAAVGIHDHLLAVHGPLLWLPDFHYGLSWLPSPYRPEAIVTALLDMPVRPLSLATGEDAFRDAVHARLAEGSFIAARLLIQAGTFYGVDDETRANLADDCDANLGSCRSDLKDSLDSTRRLIDKVQRMGSLVRIDQANAVFAVLDRINPDNLPAEVSLDARIEDEEPEQIMDFGSARDQIEDVRDRVSSLLDGPRVALLGRLDTLQGQARQGDVARVREIINAHDDLVTAGDYISFMEEGGELPEKPIANRRHHEFFPRVPDTLAKLGKQALDAARTAIEAGADLDVLPYSRVPKALCGEALDMIDIWRDLRRRVERGDNESTVHALLDRLFMAARMSPVVLSPTVTGVKLLSKTYFAEMHFTILEDKTSLLLPDFGSVVDFNYKIAVTSKLPTDGEMAHLCHDAGTYGIIVLVTALVEAERRKQLQIACLEHNRRVLVIDEAVLLYALSELEFRPLTLIECAQPFSFAAPYKDYGNSPVPREMFFGRETEIRKIVDRMGSCVVYGGRRLGKTALLRHIKEHHSDAQNNGSTAVGYANIRDIGATPSRVWEAASRDLAAIFNAPVKTAAEFIAKVQAWLKADSKRRVILLLDEADNFIEGDSKQQFPEFTRLQELMDDTTRRFKVVLAGLHNVTRIVRTENSPLKQIASDPQRIGPLMDKELPDAERLVTRPMLALGYEFKNRSDVWRILSHCNYYPVLVQTFCQGLLSNLEKAAVRRRRPVGEITNRHVREAIEDEGIRKEIEEKFGYTIREIDPRYELITCVVAERVLRDTQAGRVDEGMSTVEVLDSVATWWPVAFDHANRLETVKDLLDEMVGLGVLRQTASGAWVLRSHAILRLLGDEDHVNTRLLSFETRPQPLAFDPRSMRRDLTLAKEVPGYPCPLTWGQEHDLFAGSAHIAVVFGNTLADVAYVPDALRSAEPATRDGTKLSVMVRHFADVTDMLEALKPLARANNRVMLVIEPRTKWDITWIEAATRQRAVREGAVRVTFVGSATHALGWVRSPRLAKLPQGVRVMALQSWADAFLGHELGDGNLPPERFTSDLRRITGGFNRPMSWALTGFSGSVDRFAKHLKTVEVRLTKERDLLADLGLAPPMAELFMRLVEWVDGNGRIGLEEIRDGVGEMLQSLDLTAIQVTDFGVMMGVLEPLATRPGDPPESRGFIILPLVKIALAQRQIKSEAA